MIFLGGGGGEDLQVFPLSFNMGQDSAVNIATHYGLDSPGIAS